jgi:pilus assembly protein Flp/PilA
MEILKQLLRDEEGQGMVEYGIIVALIAVVVIGAVKTLGNNTKNTFDHVNQTMDGQLPH